MPFSRKNRGSTFHGILFVALFALSSLYLAEMAWIVKSGISSLIIAIVLGMIYSNTLRHHLPHEWTAGIQFSAKHLLRLAIVLYGFRISFQQIVSVGVEGFLIDSVVVFVTLLVGTWVGVKVFKLDHKLALLISAGAAICGAAAVLAVEDVLKSEPYKATVAVGTVVLFGTLSMFLYPLLQHAGLFGFTDSQYGLLVGATVHEVAQAVVAGNDVSTQAGDVAIIVKMTRVLLLVPVLILLSISQKQTKSRLVIPWFAILFVGMIGVNSLHLFSASMIMWINQLDVFLLTMAMAAIGIETNFGKIKQVGWKPLYFAFVLFAGLLLGGLSQTLQLLFFLLISYSKYMTICHKYQQLQIAHR